MEPGEFEIDPTERFSFLSHAIGAAAAIVGLVLLIGRAQGTLAVTCVVVYGASLIVLLVNSSLHHAIHPRHPGGRRALKMLDHISIYLHIAGTYTPAALIGMANTAGWVLFSLVWGFALAGIVAKVLWRTAPRWVSTAFFVGVGWSVLAVLPAFLNHFPWQASALTFGGGLFYTGGAVIYASQRPDPWPTWFGFHGLWHMVVLVGAGMHFAFVYDYVLP